MNSWDDFMVEESLKHLLTNWGKIPSRVEVLQNLKELLGNPLEEFQYTKNCSNNSLWNLCGNPRGFNS